MSASSSDGGLGCFAVWIGGGLLVSGLVAALLGIISAPGYFIAVASLLAILALLAMYQSFRGVFGHRGMATGHRASLPERAALLDEKNALLRAIKDIAFEHEVGKLSDADFQRLDRSYRLRAKDVLRKLDEDLAPFIERAEKLVAGTLEPEAPREVAPAKSSLARGGPRDRKAKKRGEERREERRECPKCQTLNRADAEWCKECGGRVAPLTCAACGSANEPDAKFCIKCAAELKPSAARDGGEGDA
jgi:hypothetical protein